MILINELLHENKLSYSDINCIAVNVGPISFTGMRVGIAAAQGISIVNSAKIIAVTTLEYLGYNHPPSIVYLPANIREYYMKIFYNDEELINDDHDNYDLFAIEDIEKKIQENPKAEIVGYSDKLSIDVNLDSMGKIAFERIEVKKYHHCNPIYPKYRAN